MAGDGNLYTHGTEHFFGFTQLSEPSGVHSIWLRHQLQSRKLRQRALESKVAKEGLILTEAQVIALERQQTINEAHGEIETEHPGYLGSQDTYYVGMIKGIGRIYQQTFVDTYSMVAACKLYTTKTPITAADLLNDRLLPLLESEGVDLLRILTDRGTEFCGRPERHDYQPYCGTAPHCSLKRCRFATNHCMAMMELVELIRPP